MGDDWYNGAHPKNHPKANVEESMTELLFLTDAYLSEFDATVTAVTDDGSVVLDRTAFYIGAAGSPATWVRSPIRQALSFVFRKRPVPVVPSCTR